MFSSNGFLWRSLKYELIYPGAKVTSPLASNCSSALENYFHFLQSPCVPHQALGYRTPADLFPGTNPKKEEVVVMMGDAVPQTPWDLSLSFSKNGCFFLYCKRHLP